MAGVLSSQFVIKKKKKVVQYHTTKRKKKKTGKFLALHITINIKLTSTIFLYQN